MSLYQEKMRQACQIVQEEGVDVWLIIARETVMNNDPVLQLISPVDFGGMTCVFITKDGQSIALASQLDHLGLEQTETYDEVVDYGLDFEAGFFAMMERLAPHTVALNYSRDVAADGLTHGMYLYLMELFQKCGFDGQIVSAEHIIGKLRGRKTPEEIRRIREATKMTEKILREVTGFIKEGVSQKDIYDFCQQRIAYYGVEDAWDHAQNPGVFIGPNPVIGHAGPGAVSYTHLDVYKRQTSLWTTARTISLPTAFPRACTICLKPACPRRSWPRSSAPSTLSRTGSRPATARNWCDTVR